MSNIVSKPSKAYAENFAAIFGEQPKRRGKGRRFFVRSNGKTIEAHQKPRRQLGVAQWPMRSLAFGVNPSQAKEAYEESVRKGIPTEYDPITGDAIFRSRGHRKRAVEALGDGRYFDLDGGYGDPQPPVKRTCIDVD